MRDCLKFLLLLREMKLATYSVDHDGVMGMPDRLRFLATYAVVHLPGQFLSPSIYFKATYSVVHEINNN